MRDTIETIEYKGLNVNFYHDYDYEDDYAFKHPEPYHTFGSWNGYALFEHEGKGYDWLQHILTEYHDEITDKYKSLIFSDCLEDYDCDAEYKDIGACTSSAKAEELIEKWVESELIYLPIYIYEHGGITMRAGSGFSCRWDSGQGGYIYMSKNEARKNYNKKRVDVKQIEKNMIGYIEYLDAICTGSVYGFTVENSDGDVLDSCWGFVETEYPLEKTEVYAQAMDSAKWEYNNIMRKHLEKRKAEIKNHAPVAVRTAFGV